MSAEVYLYGLSEDGGKTFVTLQSMDKDRAREDSGEGWEWVRVSSIPEAVASPMMREALEFYADPANWWKTTLDSALGETAREALAACGPDYTPTPSNEARLRVALKKAARALTAYGADVDADAAEIALAADAPPTDPRDEEIKRLREALEYANKSLINAGFHGGSEVITKALRGDK